MELGKFISISICEYLNTSIGNRNETLDGFINRFKNKNKNPKFLENHFKVPNFRLELTHDGNVKIKKVDCAVPNKCETNTFDFIKSMIKINNHRYYPVSGWCFLESTTYFEHFWVYDAFDDIFLDVTPMMGGLPYAYGGVINFDINDDILNAEKYNDIPFLLGKTGNSLYKNHENSKVLPKILKQDKNIFDFINKSDKYKDLSKFINDNNITTIEELKKTLTKLEDKQQTVRNNREWNYYDKLIQQIRYIDI